jgi:hypothetical protein
MDDTYVRHEKDGISYYRYAEMSEIDAELFGYFNNLAACPVIDGEDSICYSNDFERYLARKKSYLNKFGGVEEFRIQLQKHYGYVPFA